MIIFFIFFLHLSKIFFIFFLMKIPNWSFLMHPSIVFFCFVLFWAQFFGPGPNQSYVFSSDFSQLLMDVYIWLFWNQGTISQMLECCSNTNPCWICDKCRVPIFSSSLHRRCDRLSSTGPCLFVPVLYPGVLSRQLGLNWWIGAEEKNENTSVLSCPVPQCLLHRDVRETDGNHL